MKAIILAAGRGKRLSPLTDKKPKCLLPIKGSTPLERLIKQLDCDVYVVTSYLSEKIEETIGEKATILEKKQFKTNANRYSLLLGLKEVQGENDVVVFEGDMIAENALIDYVCGTDFDERNTWFSSGDFKPGMSGGIIKTDGMNKITDIKVVDEYRKTYKNYKKMAGILRIKDTKRVYHHLRSTCARRGFLGYYLDSINEYLKETPFYLGDASHYIYCTFNTPREYYNARDVSFNSPEKKGKIEMVEIDTLHPIEKHDPRRVEKVDTSRPLKIEEKHHLILDGHHRYRRAREEGKTKLPVIKYPYNEVEMWSLREELSITKNDVIENALEGTLYPIKTVKHKFPW